MNKKILAFIYNKKKNKFLILKTGDSEPEIHGDSHWFTTTGSVEENESNEEAVKRELSEETGLICEEVFDLNWGCIYEWLNQTHKEQYFLAFVDSEKIKLDKVEVIDFKWINLDEFINLIAWDDDKNLLKEVLEKAIKKEKYFNKINVKDYRK